MEHEAFMENYLGFMRWFHKEYPELYMQYVRLIEMATFNTASHFSNVDEEAEKKLEQIEEQYLNSLK